MYTHTHRENDQRNISQDKVRKEEDSDIYIKQPQGRGRKSKLGNRWEQFDIGIHKRGWKRVELSQLTQMDYCCYGGQGVGGGGGGGDILMMMIGKGGGGKASNTTNGAIKHQTKLLHSPNAIEKYIDVY